MAFKVKKGKIYIFINETKSTVKYEGKTYVHEREYLISMKKHISDKTGKEFLSGTIKIKPLYKQASLLPSDSIDDIPY